MFPTLGLLRTVPCPDLSRDCQRAPCLFSHSVQPNVRRESANPAPIPVRPAVKRPAPALAAAAAKLAKTSPPSPVKPQPSTSVSNAVPAPVARRSALTATSSPSSSAPRSASAVTPAPFSVSVRLPGHRALWLFLLFLLADPTHDQAGPPRLHARAATSHTDLPTRQKVVNLYYTAFLDLYRTLDGDRGPSLASTHALAQELNVYTSTGKSGYRNASAHGTLPPTCFHRA
jgi:RNA exonuclease 1